MTAKAAAPKTDQTKADRKKISVEKRVRNAATGASVRVVAGLDVVHEDRLKRVVAVSHEHVYLTDAVTQESVQVAHGEYELPQPKALEARLLADTSEKDRQRAHDIHKVLGPLVELGRNLTAGELETACRELRLSDRSTREYLRFLQVYNHWTSCLRSKPGPQKGSRYIKGPRLAILDTVLTRELSKEEGITEDSVVKAVNDCIEDAGLPRLDPKTIRKHLRAQASVDLRRRRRLSGKAEVEAITPVGDGETAERPLQKVQIDSTRADVIVVDENGEAIRRPWVTFCIDVFSRCVLGIYISLDAPSAVAVGATITDALFPKNRRLKHLDLGHLEWPCYGKFESITGLDHGSEHLNKAIDHGIKMMGLPEPKWRTDVLDGAIIERTIGTFCGKMHLLPGTTWSNVKNKGNYKSEMTAVLQIHEFEAWMVAAVIEYLNTPHRGLNRITPLQMWQRGWKASAVKTPPLIQNERETRVSFLPFEFRTATKEGIEINGEQYRTPQLAYLIRRHARVQVHYDPRDLSKVWVRSPYDQSLLEVPWKHRNRRPHSMAYRTAKNISDGRLGRSAEAAHNAKKARQTGNAVVMKATKNTKRRRRENETLEKNRSKQAERELGTPSMRRTPEPNTPAKAVDWSTPPPRFRTWSR